MANKVKRSSLGLPSPVGQNGKLLGVSGDEYSLQNSSTGLPIKIAVIGDSTSVQNPLTDFSWPQWLELIMSHSGANVRVVNYSRGGMTSYNALTDTQWNGQTASQRVIAESPDIIIIQLGVVETMLSSGRSLAQCKADIASLISALKAALPSVKIVYSSQLAYDSANFTPTSLKNKGVVPAFFTLRSSGIFSGLYCTDMLEDALSTATRNLYTNWLEWDLYVKALTDVSCSFSTNYWKIARLGCTGPDGLHIDSYGHSLLAGYVIKGLRTASWFTALFTNYISKENSAGEDPDLLFSDQMTAYGDGWSWTPGAVGESISTQKKLGRQLFPETWYTPYKGKFSLDANYPGNPLQPSGIFLRDGPRSSTVYVSVDGAAFASLGCSTDKAGNLIFNSDGSAPILSDGSHTLYFYCGAEVYGPFSITVSNSQAPTVSAKITASQSLPAATNTTVIFNAEDLDTHAAYNNTTGFFTAPAKGKYLLTYSLRLDTVPASGLIGGSILVNGTQIAEVVNYNGPAIGGISCFVSCVHPLEPNDVVKCNAFVASGASVTIGPGAAGGGTKFTARWLGY